MLFNYSSFIVTFEIRMCKFSDFLFFKIFFGYIVAPLYFYINCRISLSISTKKSAGILIGID